MRGVDEVNVNDTHIIMKKSATQIPSPAIHFFEKNHDNSKTRMQNRKLDGIVGDCESKHQQWLAIPIPALLLLTDIEDYLNHVSF